MRDQFVLFVFLDKFLWSTNTDSWLIIWFHTGTQHALYACWWPAGNSGLCSVGCKLKAVVCLFLVIPHFVKHLTRLLKLFSVQHALEENHSPVETLWMQNCHSITEKYQIPRVELHISLGEALYLWCVVSTDSRAEHWVNQKLEGITYPPGSTCIREVFDGFQHLPQWAVICQSNPHPARKVLEEKVDDVQIMEQIHSTNTVRCVWTSLFAAVTQNWKSVSLCICFSTWKCCKTHLYEFYLGTSPKTVTPKRTPSAPMTLSWKEEVIAEMKSLTLEKLFWPTLHDSSTRNTMSACTTVLHAEGRRKDQLVCAWIQREDKLNFIKLFSCCVHLEDKKTIIQHFQIC